MNYHDELILLASYGRGRKPIARRDLRYQYYRRAEHKTPYAEPKVSRMLRVALAKPQAILKISSYGKGRSKVTAHVNYISRNGQLSLEDQHENLYETRAEQREIINHWSTDFGTNKRSRDTLNLVLSAPSGYHRESLLKASREFLKQEFGTGHDRHEYLFVAHDDTAHPHVHAVIKMVSNLGHKLNPRKAYLNKLRENFAELCREQGIDVDASSRCERGLSGHSLKSSCVQMKKAKRMPEIEKTLINKVKNEFEKDKNSNHPSAIKMRKRNQIIRKRYADTAKKLYQNSLKYGDSQTGKEYRAASEILNDFSKMMPLEKTRGDRLHEKINHTLEIISKEKQAKLDSAQSLSEYIAVTQGQQSEQGIFISPQISKGKDLFSMPLYDNLSYDREKIEWDYDDDN